jgi:hypothetical protein
MSVRHHIADDAKDPIVASGSGIGMHCDIAGAIVVKVADPVYLKVRANLRHYRAAYDCIVVDG